MQDGPGIDDDVSAGAPQSPEGSTDSPDSLTPLRRPHQPDLLTQHRLAIDAACACDPQAIHRLAVELTMAEGAQDVCIDIELNSGIDGAGDLGAALPPYLLRGHIDALPEPLRDGVRAQVLHAPHVLDAGTSGRLMALLAALQALPVHLDRHPVGRAALNFTHTSLRSLGSAGLTTVARQAVGRALDLALLQGASELARTLMGAAMMGLPVIGQAVLLARDEMRGDATAYSRATRVVLMGLAVGVGGLALGTGTLTSPGLRLAEVVLYPLLRDAAQAVFPIISSPDSGPTKTSLAAAGAAYAANQLAVSRAFVVAPDVGADGVIPSGLFIRGLANAAGESVDLMSLLYAHHLCRHGTSPSPRLRIGRGELGAALRSPLHWDTMFARGCFVAGFNQLYDTLLADHTLTRALTDLVGRDRAAVVADWLTEGIAFGMTVLTYPFWTDPPHARGYVLPERAMEEGRLGEDAASMQYAGNRAEPPVAGSDAPVALVSYVDERRAAPLTTPTADASPAPE